MYGTETVAAITAVSALFENDVKMYGTETPSPPSTLSSCLRMM